MESEPNVLVHGRGSFWCECTSGDGDASGCDSCLRLVDSEAHILSLLPVLLKEVQGQKIHPSANVHPSAVVEGDVILEEGVRVLPHATITGPCFVGKNS